MMPPFRDGTMNDSSPRIDTDPDRLAPSSPPSRSMSLPDRPGLLAASLLTALAIFLLDLQLPAGLAVGILYVTVIAMTSLIRPDWIMYAAAGLCTVLIVMDIPFSAPGDGPYWMAYVNRAISVLAIWGAAWFRAQRRQAERNVSSIIESAPTGMLIVDAAGIIRQVNGLVERLSGYRREELLGQSVERLIPEQLRQGHTAFREKFMERPVSRVMGIGRDLWLRRNGGEHVPVEIALTPLRLSGKNLVLCTVIDISYRKELERNLRRREEQYRLLVTSVPEAVYRAVPDQRFAVTFVSKLWTEWTGLTEEESYRCANVWESILHPDDRESVIRTIREAVIRRDQIDCEHRILHVRDGTVRYVKHRAVPVEDASDREALYYGGLITDVTDLKRTEMALQELNARLEDQVAKRTEVLERKTALLRRMATELTMAEQRERKQLAKDLHDYLAQLLVVCGIKLHQAMRRTEEAAVRQQLTEMRSMLDESLAYTRTLVAQLSPRVLYEAGLVAAVRWLGEWMGRQGLTVTVEAADGVPPLKDEQAVLLYQSVRELLFNVFKHAGVGEAAVTVRMEGGSLVVAVSDAGKGFDAGKLSDEGAEAGSRFGLFSIQERLDALGGSVRLSSAPGQGCRVELRVPLQVGKPAALAADLTCLLADDRAMVRQGIRCLLETYPDVPVEIVAEAEDGAQAVELACRLQPELVILDVYMPKVDGVEATKRIVRALPNVKVIGLSVEQDERVQQAMKEAGAAAFLVKDGMATDLYNIVRRIWEDRSQATPRADAAAEG